MNETSTAPAPITEDQLREFSTSVADLRNRLPQVDTLTSTVSTVQAALADLTAQVDEIRRKALLAMPLPGPRTPGHPSYGLSVHCMSTAILHCERSGCLDLLTTSQRDRFLDFARHSLGLSVKAALTTNEIPLPENFASEVRELIADYGTVRKHMFHYPIGMGTARPARMGGRPAFGSIAMSAAFTDKAPAFEFASLESHKVGGVVRVPRELDEQSLVSMGGFLARYGAIEFARAEDNWGFLADGTAPFEGVKGIVKIARDLGNTVVLAATKTKPSDVSLDDFRALRRKANKATLQGRRGAYCVDATWETRLPGLRTEADPTVYQRHPDGSATLDGYPIIWANVLEPYGTAAAPDKPVAVFGDLSFWWLGEHGRPRIDTSGHVLFINDQLAVRFIEEIDFDYAAPDATAVLLTAAA